MGFKCNKNTFLIAGEICVWYLFKNVGSSTYVAINYPGDKYEILCYLHSQMKNRGSNEEKKSKFVNCTLLVNR